VSREARQRRRTRPRSAPQSCGCARTAIATRRSRRSSRRSKTGAASGGRGGDGGELRLPVEAGLRRGFVRARATTTEGRGSELSVEVVEAAGGCTAPRGAAARRGGAGDGRRALALLPGARAAGAAGLVLGAALWLAILSRCGTRAADYGDAKRPWQERATPPTRP
jgi:hypothetical protein